MNAAFSVIWFLLSFHFKKKLIYQLLSIIILLLFSPFSLIPFHSPSIPLFSFLAIFVILLSHYKI